MKERLEQFFNHRMGLAITLLLCAIFTLIFVIPKVFLSLDQNSKKFFWGTFLFCFGILMFFLTSKKKQGDAVQEKTKPVPTSLSYQQLVDEASECLWGLKKQQIWAYSCLIMGWAVLWIGRWSGHPHYSHPIFALPVFALAFLAATRSWEKIHAMDVNLAKYAIEGVAIEKKRPEQSQYFHAFLNSFQGKGMWKFAFNRVSPSLMIIFSLLNAGPLTLALNHFSLPVWMGSCFIGVILGSLFMFFGRMACRPYYWLLNKIKTLPA